MTDFRDVQNQRFITLWARARAPVAAPRETSAKMGSTHIVSRQGNDEVYHETQRRMWCALHALNALLQEPAYDAAALTEIALSIGGKLELAHRWPLMGNWDINVMMLALQQRGLEVQWWDRRRSIDELRSLAEEADCVGLICNEPGAWLFGLIPSQHWFTIRIVRGEWYDLDSKLQRPAKQGTDVLFSRLRRLLGHEAGQVLVVVRRPAAQGEGTSAQPVGLTSGVAQPKTESDGGSPPVPQSQAGSRRIM